MKVMHKGWLITAVAVCFVSAMGVGPNISQQGTTPPAEFQPATTEETIAQARETLRSDAPDYTLVERLANSILADEPGHAYATFLLARAYSVTQRRGQAIPLYQDYLKTPEGRNDWEGYYHLAQQFMQDGYNLLARSQLREALKLNPVEAKIFNSLATVELNLNSYQEAFELAQRSIELDPSMPEYYTVQARALAYLNRFDEAVQTAKTAVQMTQSRLEAATDRDERAVKINDLDFYHNTLLGVYQMYADAEPDNGRVYLEYSKTLQENVKVKNLAQLVTALYVAEAGLAAAKPSPLIDQYFDAADLQFKLQFYADAEATIQIILDKEPNNERAKRWLDNLRRRTDTTPTPESNP